MPELIKQRIEECYTQADRHFSRSFLRPEFRLDLRGQAAGMAYPGDNLLRFNASLYRSNHVHFLQQTVAHEVAHLLAYQLYGKHIRPHGNQWRGIMHNLFNLPAERCHNYLLPPVWKTLYSYACQCRKHELSAQRHGRINRGQSYLCRACHQPLCFTGQAVRKLVER